MHDSFSDLRRELEKLAASLVTTTSIHDCSEIARALAYRYGDLERALLLAHWTDPSTSQTWLIRSASFIIEGGNYISLDQHPEAPSLELKPDSDVETLAARLGFVPATSSIASEHNTWLMIESASDAGETKNIAYQTCALYQRMFLSSRNFENFIDGKVYFLSRPKKELAAHPRFESYAEIAHAVREKFELGAAFFVFLGKRKSGEEVEIRATEFRQPDNSRIDEAVPFYDDPRFQKKLAVSIRLRQSIVGYSEDALGAHFCIFPAFDVSVRGGPVEGVLIAWSPKPFDLMAYKASGTWLREFSARRHLDKSRFLKELRMRAQNELDSAAKAEGGVPGRKDRQYSLREVADFLCEGICNLTNAESASFRLKHDTERIARLYGLYATPLGKYKPDAIATRSKMDIRLDEWRTSAVAFAFAYPVAVPYLYIDDIEQIPERFRQSGLESVLRHRDGMRCEMVVRVCRGGMLAAVINIESPIQKALEIDSDFYFDCATVISDFITRMEPIGDWAGLATVATTQLEIHAIKSLLVAWKPENVGDAVTIVQRMKNRLLSNAEDQRTARQRPEIPENVAAFNLGMASRFENWLRDVESDKSISDVLHGCVPSDFPSEELSSLEVIFDSIWNNITAHAPIEKSEIFFSADDQAYGRQRMLTIHWRSSAQLPDQLDIDKVLLRPTADRKGHHFGFFLIGVHARLLGGHVELQRSQPPAKGFSLRAFIPYDKARI